jgi:uncharacterized membrane protein YvbJ
MFCRKCGKEVSAGDVFCGACGQATNASIVVSPQVTSTSAVKVAIGVFLGIIAVIIAVGAYASVGGVFLICAALAVLAILVAVGAFRKQLR